MKFNLKDFIEANSLCGGPGHVFVLFKNRRVFKFKNLKSITELYLDSVSRIFGSKWCNIDPGRIRIMSDFEKYVPLDELHDVFKCEILVGAEKQEEYGVYMNNIEFEQNDFLQKAITLFLSNPLVTRQSIPNIDIELSLKDPVDIERMISKNKEMQEAIRKEIEPR